MTAIEIEPPRAGPARFMDALGYRAPFLTDKLLKEQIVERAEDGDALFAEVLKYLVLDRTYPTKQWEMFSRRVDEVWHQFVLFTVEYVEFCMRYFGQYLHHTPAGSPSMPPRPPTGTPGISPWDDFARHYEALFGMPVPQLWLDRTAITPRQRVVIETRAGELRLEERAGSNMVTLACARGSVLAVSDLARPALEFIIRTKAFYVRELPGGLSDEEKVGVVETLVARHILLVAP